MAVLGIVAEFNPFHNGHQYLINSVKEKNIFEAIVCVMSGSYTQRGEPAICSKWARAEMALNAGVDLVIELPFCFATRSAYYFAKGAVQLLELTKVVTHIAFGSEIGNIQQLKAIAQLLNNEPDDYRKYLKAQLDKGLSYPVARSIALRDYFNNPDLDSVLSGSNNILGIEYLRVLQEINSDIIPLTIKRHGSSYHSTNLGNFASATAIRQALYDNKTLEEIDYAIPSFTKQILEREIEQGRAPVEEKTFNHMILTKLRTMDESKIADLYDVSEGLESRILEKCITSTNLNELKQDIKSKRYSLTRINRILLYSLFNLDKNTVGELDQCGPLYHHILGFSEKGIKLLQQINQNSPLPVLNRGKDVKALFDKKDTLAGKMISLDIMATNVYNLFFPNPDQRTGGSDFTTSPVKLL